MDIPSSKLAASDSDDSSSRTDDPSASIEEFQIQYILEPSFDKGTTTEASTSSSQQMISCEICIEDIPKSNMFEIEGCAHSFCLDCVRKHIISKRQENKVSINCPAEDCRNTIEPGHVKPIVPEEVFDRWEVEIAKSAFLECEKIHCPYNSCSMFLTGDGNVITEAVCPGCRKKFCAVCKVPWHEGLDCKEYKSSKHNKKEEEGLRSWAKEKKAMECPKCKMLVEKRSGCIHMTCRCGAQFCYACGEEWMSDSHFKNCKGKKPL